MSLPVTSIRKTRIAPTPSGYLHVGNLYNFALTAAVAHKHNAAILLRIDDIDRQRVNLAYIQDIFDTLTFLNIPWHEGPRNAQELEHQWGQQHRIHLYNAALQQLRQQGLVFACACSRSTVSQSDSASYPGTCLHSNLGFDDNAWRLNTLHAQILTVKNMQGGAAGYELPANMQHFVVRKKDGHAAYQLASVIDDLYFNIDLVVRGADLWPSTIAQQYLALRLKQPAFGNIQFYHHGLLMADDGQKLSKSAGDTSIQYLRKQGKTAEEIYALVGQMAGIGKIKSWKDIDVEAME